MDDIERRAIDMVVKRGWIYDGDYEQRVYFYESEFYPGTSPMIIVSVTPQMLIERIRELENKHEPS